MLEIGLLIGGRDFTFLEWVVVPNMFRRLVAVKEQRVFHITECELHLGKLVKLLIGVLNSRIAVV